MATPITDRDAPRAVVLGSVHMDLIAQAARLPGPGESVAGGTFTMGPGGKGGNQACQFVRAGGTAQMVTRLGDDLFGRQLLDGLGAMGVDTSLVATDDTAPTGASTIFSVEGDYSSIIAPGAAARLSIGDIHRAAAAIAEADALILQLELPAEASAHAAAIAADAGTTVILNASPSPASWAGIPDALWRATSLLVVNRVEAGSLLGRSLSLANIEASVAELSERLAIGTIVVTLGADGAVAFERAATIKQPAFPAEVVDAVGAGDAFLGTLALTYLESRPLADALRRGAAAGALALSRRGVWDALPSRAEVDAFLSKRPLAH